MLSFSPELSIVVSRVLASALVRAAFLTPMLLAPCGIQLHVKQSLMKLRGQPKEYGRPETALPATGKRVIAIGDYVIDTNGLPKDRTGQGSSEEGRRR